MNSAILNLYDIKLNTFSASQLNSFPWKEEVGLLYHQALSVSLHYGFKPDFHKQNEINAILDDDTVFLAINNISMVDMQT
jgi:hypothetical protein